MAEKDREHESRQDRLDDEQTVADREQDRLDVAQTRLDVDVTNVLPAPILMELRERAEA